MYRVGPTLPSVLLRARHEAADEGEDAPEEDAPGHDGLPGVAVAEVAKEGSKEHVGDDEGGLEDARHSIARAELFLDIFKDSCKKIRISSVHSHVLGFK